MRHIEKKIFWFLVIYKEANHNLGKKLKLKVKQTKTKFSYILSVWQSSNYTLCKFGWNIL